MSSPTVAAQQEHVGRFARIQYALMKTNEIRRNIRRGVGVSRGDDVVSNRVVQREARWPGGRGMIAGVCKYKAGGAAMVARLLVLFALVSLANCTGGGGYSAGSNPPATIPQANSTTTSHPIPTLLPQHAYVDDLSNVLIFALPLTPASVPIGRFYVSSAVTGCSDNQGRLFVLDGVFIHVFTQPISPQSTEAFRLRLQNNVGCAVGPAGNLYVSDSTGPGYMVVYAAPVQAGSRPVAEIVVGILPNGVTTDNVGHVFLTSDASGGNNIQEFSPRSSGNKLVATFGSNDFGSVGAAIGPDGNLYVASGAVGFGFGTGFIDVYLPTAFHNGGVRHRSIFLSSGEVNQIAFGINGDMIVSAPGCLPPPFIAQRPCQTRLYVLHPPYTTSAFSIPTPGFVRGIAITQ